jgi:hypothetical protein
VGRETRFKLSTGYGLAAFEVWQVTRHYSYQPLIEIFGGSHTDPDGIVVPGIGTNYPGEFCLRAAASAPAAPRLK